MATLIKYADTAVIVMGSPLVRSLKAIQATPVAPPRIIDINKTPMAAPITKDILSVEATEQPSTNTKVRPPTAPRPPKTITSTLTVPTVAPIMKGISNTNISQETQSLQIECIISDPLSKKRKSSSTKIVELMPTSEVAQLIMTPPPTVAPITPVTVVRPNTALRARVTSVVQLFENGVSSVQKRPPTFLPYRKEGVAQESGLNHIPTNALHPRVSHMHRSLMVCFTPAFFFLYLWCMYFF